MISLRDYQSNDETLIRRAYADRFEAPLYVLPCGGGKTVTFASIAHSAQRRGKRVLILCHRVELIDQIESTLGEFDVMPDIIAAGYARRIRRHGIVTRRANASIAVASVQTLVRRLDSYAAPDLIIIDEAHHTCAGSWATILRKYPKAKRLGVTASPIRTDGRGLGAHFDTMIVGPSVKELTERGYLAKVRLFAPPTVDTSGLHVRAGDYKTEESEALIDRPSITGDVLEHYRKHAPNLPALVFCTSVAHAHHVAERFRQENVSAVALDGSTDKDQRRKAVDDFKNNRIQVITQCEIATEGWDLPGVHCGIFMRPTQSMGLWIQMTGRCSRVSPGKTHAILLDHVGNCQRLGMPDEDREWELTADVIKKKRSAEAAPRRCLWCFAMSPPFSRLCVECGQPFELKPRQEIEERSGELQEVTPEELARRRERSLQGRASTLAQLTEFAKMKGYAEGWAKHVWEAREAKKQKSQERTGLIDLNGDVTGE